MTWIPTSERLPDDEQDVLFAFASPQKPPGRGHRLGAQGRSQRWLDLSACDWDGIPEEYQDSEVTHWMPVPEPP